MRNGFWKSILIVSIFCLTLYTLYQPKPVHASCMEGTTPCSAGQICNPGVSICPSDSICYNPFPREQNSVYTCMLRSALGQGSTGTSIGINMEGLFRSNLTRYFTSIGGLLSSTLNQIFLIALLLVLFYFIWAAYRYLLSKGDPKSVEAAKAQLTWAAIGTTVVFISMGFFQLLNALLGNPF